MDIIELIVVYATISKYTNEIELANFEGLFYDIFLKWVLSFLNLVHFANHSLLLLTLKNGQNC
jgi:hypothetical protein